MENTKDKTIRYLQDSHAAENGTADIFEGHAKDNDLDASTRQMASEFLAQTREKQRMIEGRVKELGGGTSGTKDFVNNMLSKASDLLNIAHNDEDKMTQDLIKTFAAENLLLGSYESLRAYCSTVGDNDTAQLAVQLRNTSEAIAKKVFGAIGAKAPEAANTATGSTTGASY